MPLRVLLIASIFQKFMYTPRDLMNKAVESGVVEQEFESAPPMSFMVNRVNPAQQRRQQLLRAYCLQIYIL